MKYTCLLSLLFFQYGSFAQASDTAQMTLKNKKSVATFIATINAANATKDGIYLNGYVVNLPYDQIKKLHGKKVKVTGKVTVVKGIKDKPGEPQRQGRLSDTEHIKHPSIEVINP